MISQIETTTDYDAFKAFNEERIRTQVEATAEQIRAMRILSHIELGHAMNVDKALSQGITGTGNAEVAERINRSWELLEAGNTVLADSLNGQYGRGYYDQVMGFTSPPYTELVEEERSASSDMATLFSLVGPLMLGVAEDRLRRVD